MGSADGRGEVGVFLYPDPEQGSGDTKLKSSVLTIENAVINQIEDNKNTSLVITNFVLIDKCSIKPKMEMNFNV